MFQTTNQYILGDEHPFSSDFGVHRAFDGFLNQAKKLQRNVSRATREHHHSCNLQASDPNDKEPDAAQKDFPKRYDFQRDKKNLGWLPSKQMIYHTSGLPSTPWIHDDPRHTVPLPNFSVAQEALKILRKMAENDVTMSLIAAQMEPIEAQKPIQRYIYQWPRQ